MIIANFTPDPINWMHIGITGIVAPGETVEMDESRARHVLNKFAPRGLVQMQYGDDEKVKKKESMALWVRFWEQQVTAFNQHNEDQKEKGNRYARPTPELEAKAKVLGLELLQPWKIKVKDDGQIKELRNENAVLKATVGEQTRQIAQILDMLKAGPEEAKLQTVEELAIADIIAANRKRYIRLTDKNMAGWLKNNWNEIQEMPEENKFEIKTKYEEFYQTSFPVETPT